MLARIRDLFGTWLLLELFQGLRLTGRHLFQGFLGALRLHPVHDLKAEFRGVLDAFAYQLHAGARSHPGYSPSAVAGSPGNATRRAVLYTELPT